MKKIGIVFSIFLFVVSIFALKAYSETSFSGALRTCEKFSQQGTIPYQGQQFTVLITLNKMRSDTCVYKEKIIQDNKYQMLTCNIPQSKLAGFADSMSKYAKTYQKEILKNKIFEAKMTTNAEIFQNFIADPKNCIITHSKK